MNDHQTYERTDGKRNSTGLPSGLAVAGLGMTLIGAIATMAVDSSWIMAWLALMLVGLYLLAIAVSPAPTE